VALARAVSALPAVTSEHLSLVAVAHSLGGYLTITQQALFSSYIGLAILGCTNQHVAPLNLDPAFIARSQTPQGRAALAEEILSALPRRISRVVEADSVSTKSVVPRVFGTAMIPGIVAERAAQIDVPVFIGYGAVDVSPEPRGEARLYSNSPDITGRPAGQRALPQHGLEPAPIVAATARLGRDRRRRSLAPTTRPTGRARPRVPRG
jgi:hypothetical protein